MIERKCGNCERYNLTCRPFVDENETFPEIDGGCKAFRPRKKKKTIDASKLCDMLLRTKMPRTKRGIYDAGFAIGYDEGYYDGAKAVEEFIKRAFKLDEEAKL